MKKLFPYLRFLKDIEKQIFIAILSGVIYGISTGLGIPVLIKVLFPVIFDNGNININIVMAIAVAPVFVTLARSACSFLNAYYVAYCGQYLLEKIRLLVFSRVQQLPLSFFNKYTPADVLTRIMGDTGVLQQALIEFAQDVVKQPITLIGTFGFMIYLCTTQSDALFLLFLIIAIPICILPIRMIGTKLRKKAHSMQSGSVNLTHRLHQNMAGIKEIRSFCMEKSEISRFKEASHEFFMQFMKVVKYNVILSPIIEVVAAMGICAAFYYAFRKNISAEVFISTISALYLSYEPLKKIGRLSNEMHRAQASLDRIEVLLNEPVTINDPMDPVKVDRLSGNISFINVNFGYNEGESVLININEKLQAGKTYALVGPSGAGKTSFANLIPRFYDNKSGSIVIDDIDIKQMKLSDLRNNIGYVTQSPTLFNDTILNNIKVGKPDATQEEVELAAKKAFAHEFILNLPQGYNTEVGENGTMLSGGQRQRIALARAFLKDAPILILDEATSALDATSEEYIQKALETLMKGKTVILIAHRFSSIKHADTILVFEKGRIIERGTHSELMQTNGLYAELYQKQVDM